MAEPDGSSRVRRALARMSVRTRMTVAAVAVMLPVLAAASVAGVLLQQRELERAVSLVAEEQARSVATEVDGSTEHEGEPLSIVSVLGGEEALVQVVDDTGAVADASPALAGTAPLVPAPDGSVSHTTLSGGLLGEDGGYAVVAVPVDGGGYVVAARSLERAEAATASTLRLLAVGIPGVLVLTGALCWVLAGRALRPVEDLRRRASEITATGAEARLPLPETSDEIHRLAETLNAMLGRLDDAALAQRRFVADASHELRSPVAAIRAVMEVVPPGTQVWEEARTDVLGETHRLAHLVDGLRVLARRDSASAPGGSRRPVALADLVVEQVDRPRRVVVEVRDRAHPWVLGDRRALGVAIGNLLDNAGRHAAHGVTVEIGLDADTAVVTVSDDGSGIPTDERERVFERFVRLDEARSRDVGGAGLGLAITRAVVEDHGGSVRVAAYDGGARLVVRLPVADTPA